MSASAFFQQSDLISLYYKLLRAGQPKKQDIDNLRPGQGMIYTVTREEEYEHMGDVEIGKFTYTYLTYKDSAGEVVNKHLFHNVIHLKGGQNHCPAINSFFGNIEREYGIDSGSLVAAGSKNSKNELDEAIERLVHPVDKQRGDRPVSFLRVNSEYIGWTWYTPRSPGNKVTLGKKQYDCNGAKIRVRTRAQLACLLEQLDAQGIKLEPVEQRNLSQELAHHLTSPSNS